MMVGVVALRPLRPRRAGGRAAEASATARSASRSTV